MLEPGTVAPDFDLEDHTGARVRLSNYRGRPVVLWFFPGADPGRTLEGCAFRDRMSQFDARGVQVFGVSVETAEESAAFASKSRLGFPLLCDTDRAICVAYGALEGRDAPTSVQRISWLIGPRGEVVKAYSRVEAAAHAAEILRDL